MYECFACMYVCTPYAYLSPKEESIGSPKTGVIWMVVSLHVSAGN